MDSPKRHSMRKIYSTLNKVSQTMLNVFVFFLGPLEVLPVFTVSLKHTDTTGSTS